MENSTKVAKSGKSAKATKPINFKAKYITLGIMVAVLIAAVVLFIIFNNRQEDAKAYMSMETNPGVQLVLDANNKVVGQVALNADGQDMLAVVSFKGLTANDAAKLFAQTATEMDKMNGKQDSTTEEGKATTVNIQISAEKTADYEKLAKSVKETVNKYFSDNGVFAGAVTSVSDKVKEAAEKMVVDAKDIAHMTTQEILNYTKETSSELEKMSLDTLTTVKTTFTKVYNELLATADQVMTQADNVFEKAKEVWAAAEKVYNDTYSKATGEAKELIQKTYDAAKKVYNDAVKTYNDAKAKFNTEKEKFEKELNTQIDKIVKDAEQSFNEIKTKAKNVYKTTKAEIDKSIEAFNKLTAEQKAEMQKKIAEFQEKLA